MKVPLLDLKLQYRQIQSEVKASLDEVMESQYFILGPKVKELEEKIARYTNTKYAVGVSSGTDALLIALMALKVGQGDEVITSPFSFFATAGVIHRLGAKPVFVDIEPDTFNLNPQLLRERITDRTRAILPVHLYGQCADMDPLNEIAAEFKIPVIEDAAQAIGSEYRGGRRAGSLGTAGCFSFFPSKNLGGYGDGGMVTTNSEQLHERLLMSRVHGAKPKYYHQIVGGNFRLDAIQAAILMVKLQYLDSWTEKRQRNAGLYTKLFHDHDLMKFVTLPVIREGYRHIFNQFVIRVQARDEIRDFLKGKDIGTEIYYPVPFHLQKCFSYLGYREGDFPESERAAGEVLAIPIYPELSAEQQEYVVAAIKEFYQEHN
jgi:dTDP-4-amino-4,6-dideoxygalactose transaminase